MTSNLLGLRAENYKRLELVEVAFPAEGGVVAIMGENEAGKTSLLDAIETTISGRKMPKAVKPVHDGADSSRIVATFDDIVVTRTFKADGATAIKVAAADGRRIDRAEELLNRLYSHVALDPLAFSRLSDAEQVATLLPMIGFDPAPLDAARQEAYDLRTVKNREVAALQARLDAYPAAYPGLPDDEISATDLAAELEKALDHNQNRRVQESTIRGLATSSEGADNLVEVKRRELAEAEAAAVKAHEVLEAAAQAFAKIDPEVDVEPLRAKIAAASETNDRIRDRRDRTRVASELAEAKQAAADLTARVEKAAADKEAALAAARMPVPGLSIDDEGVLTLNGIPFSQASTGVKIRTGTAVAMALNPDLRLIIIRDASLLDAGNRAVIDELAKANGFLVLMEIADESSPVGVVIEDGAVREVRS